MPLTPPPYLPLLPLLTLPAPYDTTVTSFPVSPLTPALPALPACRVVGSRYLLPALYPAPYTAVSASAALSGLGSLSSPV
jgi:hypothetical protein